MKKILASLLAAYALTANGQTPAGTTSAPASTAPATTSSGTTSAGTTSSGTTSSPQILTQPPIILPPIVPPGPPGVGTSAPQTTAAGPNVVTPAPAPLTTLQPTSAPTTAAPTYNPYCPMPTALGSQHGVTSGNAMSSNQGCISPFERAVAFNGILQCSTYACCQCAEIQCGDPFGLACDELVISDSGAVGNQNINVLGDMTSAFGGNSFAGIGGAMNNGAQIRCNGLEACKASRIYGKYVGQVSCSGDMGCSGANIYLEDPGHELQVQCNGMMSCMNTNLEIVITGQSQVAELGTIEFNGQQAAQGMTITIDNRGQYPVMLQNLECMNPTACPNLRINIIGNIYIENCDLQHMNIATAGPSLLAACQAGAANTGNFVPGIGGGFPAVPVGPAVPPNPVNPTPGNPGQPAGPVTPVGPTPVNPAIPAGPAVANPGIGFQAATNGQLKCEFGQCINRIIDVTPVNGMFKLICDLPGQCNGLTLNINAGSIGIYSGFGVEIDSLKFSAIQTGVTVNVNGFAQINDIRCEVPGACNGLKVNGANIDAYSLNMDCQQMGSCSQCAINGVDCNTLAIAQGNNGGAFGFYNQFGANPYQQQPAVPQQPAQPAVPQQQPAVPQQPYVDPYQQQMQQMQQMWMWQQWI